MECIWGQGENEESISAEMINLPADDSWDHRDMAQGGGKKRDREESWLPDPREQKKMDLEGISLRPRYSRQAKQVKVPEQGETRVTRQKGEKIFNELRK